MAQMREDVRWQCDETPQPHEANYLKLDSSRGTEPAVLATALAVEDCVQRTIDWHEAWRNGADMHQATLAQIADFETSNFSCLGLIFSNPLMGFLLIQRKAIEDDRGFCRAFCADEFHEAGINKPVVTNKSYPHVP